MSDGRLIGLDQQIASVRRELTLRARVYPTLVATRRMKAAESEKEQAAMQAVLATLLRLKEQEEGER